MVDGLALWQSPIARLRTANRTVARTGGTETQVRAETILKGLEDLGTGWFWTADRDGRLTYISSSVAAQLGCDDAGPLGCLVTDLFLVSGQREATERTLRFLLQTRASFKEIEVCTQASGDRTWALSGRPVLDERGQFLGFVGSGSDLTGRRRAEAEVARLAMSDPLTGLANRARMQRALDQALSRRSGQQHAVAMLLLDLDRFKAVNDTLGHQTGDALLVQVAHRLERAVGASALVGRIGGDEFQVIMIDEDDRTRLAQVARDMIAALSLPYMIKGASITIGCSIGIALAPDDGNDAETLIRNADLALYAAKGDGRGTHKFFRPEFLAQAQLRRQLEDDLRDAMEQDQLSLVYQPIVSTASGSISGYEALLRWAHPQHGQVSPVNFIPVAEESGLIEPIGEWVLRTATAAAARWSGDARIAVNVSPIQFAKPGFPALVANALAHSGLAPSRLELEITESVFLGGAEATEPTFRSLKALGVRLSLDDFGTGYSSLGYLKAAPFDKIKIDQSFVRGAMVAGNRNVAIIRAIVMLADALGMETTAEGVEAQDEIDLIRDLGCSHIQGFVYGRPIPADDIKRHDGVSEIEPSGVKITRPIRTRVLRSVSIEMDGTHVGVRLRDVSLSGAMIDQLNGIDLAPGTNLAIELQPGVFVPAVVRWSKAGRAGLQLLQTFDFRKLSASLGFGAADRVPIQKVQA